jgi:glycosyltransferase EpsF
MVSNKKIKVLHVVGAMNRGGAEIMLMDIYHNISTDFHFDFLVNYVAKNGISKGELDEEIRLKGGNIKYIGTQWSIGPFKYFKIFKKRYLELGKPSIVHIHLNAKSGIIALAAKLAGAKKIIVHSHANLKFRGTFLNRIVANTELWFQKILIGLIVEDFWGCSQEAVDSLFYKFLQKESKTQIINNAVNVDNFIGISPSEVADFKQNFGIDDNTLILGNIGRIVRHKNVGFIIEVLAELRKVNEDFKFIFAGRAEDKSYLDEVMNNVSRYNLESNVLYLGSRSDVPLLCNVFDIFMGPALQEGFGLVAVEAQAAGKPSLLYKGFPKSVDMKLGLTYFFNEFDKSEWLSTILKIQNIKEDDKALIKGNIQKLGYDIKSSVKNIELKYINMV